MFDLTKEEERPGLDFDAIRIRLASPDTIRKWSHGEVTKPETINYRTFKPEKDGLFCERIFGPVRDWECNCGKYKKIRYRGVICDRCGVEVTKSIVRRERMGHIELSVPVSHIWYFKVLPSRIGVLLDMNMRDLERVLYYESYLVTDPGETPLKKKQILGDDEYAQAREQYGNSFTAEMGAAPVRELLRHIDVEELAADLRARGRVETSVEAKKESLKRLRVVQAFCVSGNRPEWMILEVVPVIPPDLRPLVPLEGGRFATSDLNDLYRRVITRNDRLRKLIELRAPEIILRNEKRMLQEAVDALFDNSRRSRAIKGRGKRPLKSLSDILRGKQGRFRQNLLGKRVDYSGRSVIVVGPELKPFQCGLPKTMALELFKPFIIKRLEEKGYVQTVRSAKRLVEREKPGVWEILEEIVRSKVVLLNRAPTLHRLGIQAFEPVLIEGKAIKIHPLVCEAFNADFDGDQMAVHVPLSKEAQEEARNLMLSTNNILSPAHGGPLAKPRQDVVLGCYYLTKEAGGARGEGRLFSGPDEAILAYDLGEVDLHARIKVRVNGGLQETTTGRVIFNQYVPPELGFRNELLDKNSLERLVGESYRQLGSERTILFIDDLKRLGFEYATKGGLTIGIDDLVVPPEKEDLIRRGYQAVEKIDAQYQKGKITDGERYNKVVDTWTHVTNQVGEALIQQLRQDKQGFNPIYMMVESGARGSREQAYQLAGMRGLMAKPQKRITGQIGEIIETPITSNFQEGLSVVEYFISTHGARKGLADTALKTAEAGYLTRRLVDVAQDVIITEEDCGTILGQDIGALKEGEEVIETLKDRILGRVALEDVRNPLTGEVVVPTGEEVQEDAALEVEECGVERVKIRSVLTCEARRGLCRKCYGRNMATGRLVNLGEAVGVIAAQSIGEPGTQLTLRTFHIGGTAARIAAQTRAVVKNPGSVRYQQLRVVRRGDGESVAISREGAMIWESAEGRVPVRYIVPYGAVVRVADGTEVKKGDVIFEWDPYSIPILTDRKGKAEFEGLQEGRTCREELDESTGLPQRVVVEDRDKELYPVINIVDERGKRLASYSIPTGAHLLAHPGAAVAEGDLLAKLPREISKTRDITGGLPRVTELVESRKPKDQATVTEIDGIVHLGKIGRGMRLVSVENENGETREYQVPHGKHLRIREGDKVKAGDRLSEGPINPHDILRIRGATAVQEYLVNEIQEVYRIQGVRINDKHIEVIVRQMLQKVRIEDPGDTKFIEGEQVDKVELREENERVLRDGGQPATFQPLLLGITKAALSTTSFISAASFQETTRVLTDAAIQGKRDQLLGLKENVIVGRLIPAGTGFSQSRQRSGGRQGRRGNDGGK
jgi:DNA-directed RNA polymerase subunit beta'